MTEVNFKEAMNNYLSSLKGGNIIEIEKAKYKLLWEAADLFEVVMNYITLHKAGLRFNFGKDVIRKGTKLYRIRGYESNTDFSLPSAWTAPPHKPQNRANMEGQEALYLGSTECICLLETNIKKDEKYALGIYEVIDDIEVGGYILEKEENILHNDAGIVLNAFLIAPARNERNKELFFYLDSYYGKLTLNDFTNKDELIKNNIELPMKFSVLNQRNEYYNLTNQVCNILSEYIPNGIRYSSCYLPIETVGIECTHYNIVLYDKGISKIKFIDYEIKTREENFTGIDIIKCIIQSLNKEE